MEYDRFLLGPGLFSGAFAVSFREGNSHKLTFMGNLLRRRQQRSHKFPQRFGGAFHSHTWQLRIGVTSWES